MHEYVFVATKGIGKAKSLALVEPFDAGGLQRRVANDLGINLVEIGKPCVFKIIRRADGMHRHGLPTAFGLLHVQFNSGAIRNRTLAKVPQNIGM